MSNLRFHNQYYKNRGQGIRYRLETEFLNKLQYYINTEIRPLLANMAKIRALTNNPEFFHERIEELENDFTAKIEDLAMKHFRGILKLSLTEKYGCYDKETEVLTKNGWKLFKHVNYKDEIATFNIKNEELEYQKPRSITIHKAKELIQIKNNTLDIAITPNHKIWGFDRNRRNFRKYRADVLPSRLLIPRSANWKGKIQKNIEIPSYIENHYLGAQKQSHKIIHRKQIININIFLEFLGWYIAEGSIIKNTKGKYSVITLAQTKKEGRLKLKPLLEEMCFKYMNVGFKEKHDRYNIHSVQLIQFMKDFHGKKSYEKRIPRWVLELDKSHLIHIFNGLMNGDGTKYYRGKEFPAMRYATTSKGLANDVQELVLKLGYFGSIRKREPTLGGSINGRTIFGKRSLYIVNIRANNTDSWIKKKHVMVVVYNDLVYCVSVSNEIIYVRRNGLPYWCGNSWHKVPWQEVSKMLGFLWKQSNYSKKSRYFAHRIFQEVKPLFKQDFDEWYEKGHDPVVEAINDLFFKRMSMISQSIYTHSTYFINSAYEIQFKARDPLDNFRYIWGTRPDHRRTLQCEMIDKRVKDEAKKKKDKGVKLDRLEEIVNEVANMEGFKKANPNIAWTPHYQCRSSLERVV